MGEASGGEKTRLCPSCRMEISVLATKCRFCGESVGRPRDETRSLSINDLGGETVRHYAPSSSVMEAMEAFRSEHDFKSNPPEDAGPERKSLFGIAGKKKAGAAQNGDDGLPQLDERSQALASLAMPSTKPTTFKKPKGPSAAERAMQIGGILVGVIVLLFVAKFAYGYFTAAPVEGNRSKANPAEAMLARNEDPTKIVIAAAQALRAEKHTKNEDILEQAEKRFIEKINGLLNASPWTDQLLKDATKNVNDAYKVDPDPEIGKLMEELNQETFAYNMSLLEVSADGKSATFGLSQSGSRVQAEVGGIVNGRFKIVSIKGEKVQVEDTQRKGRLLTFSQNDTRVTSP
ncbi:MAG: hypothetical protein IT367_08100 [Candidatus Hydrogenedentes bacterium]|nr:hypothetical protein [Candidatus Hydrogenedentota bacterium]